MDLPFHTAPFLHVAMGLARRRGGRGGGRSGRGRGGGGRGRGRAARPFHLNPKLCAEGGRCQQQSHAVETCVYTTEAATRTYVRVDKSAPWLQKAVTGKTGFGQLKLCPVFDVIRNLYLKSVDPTTVGTEAAEAALQDAETAVDPMDAMEIAGLTCAAEKKSVSKPALDMRRSRNVKKNSRVKKWK